MLALPDTWRCESFCSPPLLQPHLLDLLTGRRGPLQRIFELATENVKGKLGTVHNPSAGQVPHISPRL